MKDYATFFLLISLSLFLQWPVDSIAQEEARTFTNKAGNAIEATLMEFMSGGKIKIKRTSDGREFELAVNTLSLEDQQYLKAVADKAEEEDSYGVNITVALPGHSVSFCKRGGLFLTAKLQRFHIPAGTWLSYGAFGSNLDIELPYLGEKTLEFSVEDEWKILLSRDGAPPTLVSIDLPEGPEAVSRIQQVIEENRFGESLHIQFSTFDNLKEVTQIPAEVLLSLKLTSARISQEIQDLLAEKKVASIEVDANPGYEKFVERLNGLRQLKINCRSIPRETPLTLPKNPHIQQLRLERIPDENGWDEQLVNFPELLALEVFGSKNSRDLKDHEPIKSFST